MSIGKTSFTGLILRDSTGGRFAFVDQGEVITLKTDVVFDSRETVTMTTTDGNAFTVMGCLVPST